MSKKGALPLDSDSDQNMPGRFEESNGNYEVVVHPAEPQKQKNYSLIIGVIVFAVFSVGFFSFYFYNQYQIDSEISKNTFGTSEKILIKKFQVGKIGSEHEHAAILITIQGEQLNLGMEQFQLKSKYVHFEDGNPYLIHRHASGVPLEMLFLSTNIEVTDDCIIIGNYSNQSSKEFCTKNGLNIYLNDKKFEGNILEYVIKQNDRVLISVDSFDLKKYLNYLNSFEIPNTERKSITNNGNEIFI